MSTQESAIGAGVTGASPDSGASPATASPAVQGTESNSSANVTTTPLDTAAQGTQETDPLAGIPSIEDAEKLDTVSKEAFLRLRGEYDKVTPQFKEVNTKWGQYEPLVSRFEQPEELQSVIELQDGLIGWERDTTSGELIPSTERGVELLSTKYPKHADFIAADLLNGMTTDPTTGRQMSRMDLALEGIAKDPQRRAETLRILGAVEPSSISPQWQPTTEELQNIALDPANPTAEEKALIDTYRRLPYEDRQELKLNSPEYIRSQLKKEQLIQELTSSKEQADQARVQQQQAREQYVAQQAEAAADTYVSSTLTDTLSTFYKSVVEQCNFIAPLDPANLPQGMTTEQAAQMNSQISASNKAEAAQITLSIIGLVNNETRAFVEPLLREIGVVDDRLMKELDAASNGFGDNGRNYAELAYRGKIGSNGSFQPDASMTNLKNQSERSLKQMVHIANQIKSRLLERRSQFFSLKAQDHNQTLNSVAASRALPSGSTYDSTRAAPAPPASGKLSRAELERMYG